MLLEKFLLQLDHTKNYSLLSMVQLLVKELMLKLNQMSQISQELNTFMIIQLTYHHITHKETLDSNYMINIITVMLIVNLVNISLPNSYKETF